MVVVAVRSACTPWGPPLSGRRVAASLPSLAPFGCAVVGGARRLWRSGVRGFFVRTADLRKPAGRRTGPPPKPTVDDDSVPLSPHTLLHAVSSLFRQLINRRGQIRFTP